MPKADCSEIKIGRFSVGPAHRPFIVAEMSGNHNQSLDRAMAIVEAAAKAGAHAVKLQTYTADSMTLNISEPPFVVDDPKSLWYGRPLYDLYTEAATPYEWHALIMERCRELGMECFSTPFDDAAVDFLESLNVPCYKIASFELTDIPLIKKVASTGKPIIMSTGMANLGEIQEAVDTARSSGANDIILLKCTSSYPASPADSNIHTIPHMRAVFGTQVGLSDHTMGIGVAVASVALGATFIEKHFTLSRAEGGVDSAFSMEPDEMHCLRLESERAWEGLGQVSYTSGSSENRSKIFRRSLIVSADIKEGEFFSKENLKRIRPQIGLACVYYENVLGSIATMDIKAGQPLSIGMWTNSN